MNFPSNCFVFVQYERVRQIWYVLGISPMKLAELEAANLYPHKGPHEFESTGSVGGAYLFNGPFLNVCGIKLPLFFQYTLVMFVH